MSIPIELIYNIETYVSDTNSFLLFRLLSKKFNKKYKIIKFFKDNKLDKTVEFIDRGMRFNFVK